jgi:hypothetical protein
MSDELDELQGRKANRRGFMDRGDCEEHALTGQLEPIANGALDNIIREGRIAGTPHIILTIPI